MRTLALLGKRDPGAPRAFFMHILLASLLVPTPSPGPNPHLALALTPTPTLTQAPTPTLTLASTLTRWPCTTPPSTSPLPPSRAS